jgi:hypothetical protein
MPVVTDEDLQRVREYCAAKVPEALQDQVRVEVTRRGDALTIVERRCPWTPEIAEWSSQRVARLRCAGVVWTLDCADSRGRWYRFDPFPTGTLDDLLEQIDEDPTGIFWG